MAKFLFILSRDDNEAATRCFQFARIAHGKGHHVNLFLIDGGVTWADTARDLTVKTTTGDCVNDYLPYLVENEVQVGKFLAINPGRVFGTVQGQTASDPAYGLPAVWIEGSLREQAQTYGYTVVDASTVVASHLNQLLLEHLDDDQRKAAKKELRDVPVRFNPTHPHSNPTRVTFKPT